MTPAAASGDTAERQVAGHLLGIDLGTTALKCLLLSPSGAIVGRSGVEMDVGQRSARRFEQDPQAWWSALVRALEGLADQGFDLAQVTAIGLSAQTHGVVLCDAGGTPLRPCLTWADMRGSDEASALAQAHRDRLRWVAGNDPDPAFSAPKIAWLAAHEPDTLARAERVLLPKDVLRGWLTGRWGTDPSDAASTLLFDLRAQAWDPVLAEAVGLDPALLPHVTGSSTVAGEVTAAAADATGLRAGTPVVTGGSDVACAALGAGVLDGDSVYMNVGTAAVIVAPAPGPDAGAYYVFQHVVPGAFLRMVSVFGAGMSHAWFAGLATELSSPQRSLDEAFAELDRLAAGVEPGSDGLLFLPYLVGRGLPRPNPDARGAFVGLTPSHQVAFAYRALLEGVSFAIRAAVEALGAPPAGYRFGGGARKSSVWTQVLADVLGARLDVIDYDASPVGAAMLAGLGTGAFAGPAEAIDRCVHQDRQVLPSESAVRDYDQAFDRFAAAVRQLDPLFGPRG